MTAGGGRHALQIMATLQNHYGRMLALDGAAVGGERDAAALLGLRGSTFPARKALSQSRRLGHDRVVRAIDLLATADLDLRGGKAWPDDLVLEVLVARLAYLAR
jgi:DNA polymerase-3 subunit delta